jgi:hypothetical protein
MQKYTEEFLDECSETLTEAEEIKGNKDLMRELEPYMKKKGNTMMNLPGTLRQKAQSKINELSKKDGGPKEDGLRIEAEDQPKIQGKS